MIMTPKINNQGINVNNPAAPIFSLTLPPQVVEIIDKGTQICIMSGVVVRYEFDGRVWDPDIVLVFEDGRRFYNENFGYMFRYYLLARGVNSP